MDGARGMHENSLAAHRAEEVKLNARERAVRAWVAEHGPHTDRQIARGMGFGNDLNAVRPRITSLLDKGEFAEVAQVRCEVSQRTVRKVGIPPVQRPLPL